MRRDPELIRKLLLTVHSDPAPEHRITPESAPGIAWPLIDEHVRLAAEENLVEVRYRVNNPACGVRLTSAGHDFCEEIVDANRWQRALSWLADKGAPPTIQAIVTAIAKIAAERLMG